MLWPTHIKNVIPRLHYKISMMRQCLFLILSVSIINNSDNNLPQRTLTNINEVKLKEKKLGWIAFLFLRHFFAGLKKIENLRLELELLNAPFNLPWGKLEAQQFPLTTSLNLSTISKQTFKHKYKFCISEHTWLFLKRQPCNGLCFVVLIWVAIK